MTKRHSFDLKVLKNQHTWNKKLIIKNYIVTVTDEWIIFNKSEVEIPCL